MRFNEVKYHDPNRLDFVPREYHQQHLRLIIVFASVLILLFIIGFVPAIRASGYMPLLSLMVVSFLSAYLMLQKQRDLDHVMATEYQNLLFVQGVSLGTNFYFFVRMDGTIVYSSEGVRKLFPALVGEDAPSLDEVLNLSGVLTTDHDRLIKAVTNCQTERLVLPIPVNGKNKEFVVTIDPLARPAGMLLVRGREYLDTRTGVQLLPDVLRSTGADRLDHLLSTSPVAHYTTDQYGRFEYVNPALERMLGYDSGELRAIRATLRSVIERMKHEDNEGLVDFSGDAVIIRKNGSTFSAMLFQSIIRDTLGKTIAATGHILPFTANRE